MGTVDKKGGGKSPRYCPFKAYFSLQNFLSTNALIFQLIFQTGPRKMRELALLLVLAGSLDAFDPYVEGPYPVRHE
jgi:hypothetical protein